MSRRLNRALVIRRFIVTTCKQGGRAPVVDDCWGNGESRADDRRWPREPSWLAPECSFKFKGKSILLAPWRRTEHGERPPMRALVLGWITERQPLDA